MDTMGSMSLILSVFAMVAALASVWFTSETIKKANSSNQQFYEANVKGMVTTLEQLAKSSVELNGKVDVLERAGKKGRRTDVNAKNPKCGKFSR